MATVDAIQQAAGAAFGVTADVRDDEGLKAAIERGIGAFGALDIVVANAGINGVWAPIDELQPVEWDTTVNTNLRGMYLTLHYTVPHLKRAGRGSIIIISSINGTRVFSHGGASACSTTKGGLLALGQMAALELAKHKIRVNVVCPGKVESKINENTQARSGEEASEPAEYPEGKIPLTDGQAGTGDDIAEMVAFLASDRARFVTGTPVWIDGLLAETAEFLLLTLVSRCGHADRADGTCVFQSISTPILQRALGRSVAIATGTKTAIFRAIGGRGKIDHTAAISGRRSATSSHVPARHPHRVGHGRSGMARRRCPSGFVADGTSIDRRGI